MTEYIVDGDCLIPRLEGLTLQIHFKTNGEIVRCRNCKYYQDHNFGSKLDWCRHFHYDVHLDGFCKWGERK